LGLGVRGDGDSKPEGEGQAKINRLAVRFLFPDDDSIHEAAISRITTATNPQSLIPNHAEEFR